VTWTHLTRRYKE